MARAVAAASMAYAVAMLWAGPAFTAPPPAVPRPGAAEGLWRRLAAPPAAHGIHADWGRRRMAVGAAAAGEGAGQVPADSPQPAGGTPSEPSDLQNILRVQAVGGSRGCFILEVGGQRLLVNPKLEGTGIEPEKVHELFDYVILTTAKDEFMHAPSVSRMSLTKVNFVATAAAGQVLSTMMVMNLAILAPGPGGRCLLTGGRPGSSPIAVLITPGADNLPWQAPECGFVFVNLETGIAVAYEALGQFLGSGAASMRDGIPEEAFQVDYLITPNLREAAGVASGLTKKGAVLRAVVKLPDPLAPAVKPEEALNPILKPLLVVDRGLDSMLGGVGDDPQEFREFLGRQGPPLSQAKLLEPVIGGDAVVLEA